MEEKFYTSTEAAEITNCSRRQLQYWRDKGVVIPTVNTTGKGRNVYYSVNDLLTLTVMHYFLSVGLSFEVCREALAMLQDKEPWLFEEFVPKKKMRRLMLISNVSQQNYLTLADFNKEAALEALCQGQTVIPFWSDRVHQQLRDNLKNFGS